MFAFPEELAVTSREFATNVVLKSRHPHDVYYPSAHKIGEKTSQCFGKPYATRQQTLKPTVATDGTLISIFYIMLKIVASC